MELASSNLSLQRIVREPPRWRDPQTRLIVGRTRSVSRTRASGSYDCWLGRRRGSVSPAFGRLTSHLRAYYRQRFARIGHGPTEAEDLLQEALIAVHTHRHTYDRSQPFTPWIHAIARYKFLDYLRRTKLTFKDLPIEEVYELTSNTDTTAIDSALDLQRLLSQISSKAREAIQYVKLDGLSVSEAAVRSGMSESAVKVAVHRGLKALAIRIRARK
jgi:RNA polymerase sigma-70 factor, ECF subfamily